MMGGNDRHSLLFNHISFRHLLTISVLTKCCYVVEYGRPLLQSTENAMHKFAPPRYSPNVKGFEIHLKNPLSVDMSKPLYC
jgi:hypothetical protein